MWLFRQQNRIFDPAFGEALLREGMRSPRTARSTSRNRMPHSPGHSPCTELETRGGIWRYDANKTNQ
jgi:hypothetical protein